MTCARLAVAPMTNLASHNSQVLLVDNSQALLVATNNAYLIVYHKHETMHGRHDARESSRVEERQHIYLLQE